MASLIGPALVIAMLACPAQGCAQPADPPAPRGSIPLRNDRLLEQHGVLLTDPKIMGGRYAKLGDDAWQVAFVRSELTVARRRAFCGGTLITTVWVVTAAHCVDLDTRPTDFYLVVGAAELTKGVAIKAIDIHIHPNYAATDHLNDIALVRLQQPVVAPAQDIPILPLSKEAEYLKWKSIARVTGWGNLAEKGDAVVDLRYVEVPVYSNKDCNDPVSYNGAIADEMVCAGFPEGMKDSCQGDSGGPLTVLVNDKRYLAGVVSWGEGCGRPNKFGVYTRPAHYATWIDECMAGTPRCKQPDPGKKMAQSRFIRDAALRRAIEFTRGRQ